MGVAELAGALCIAAAPTWLPRGGVRTGALLVCAAETLATLLVLRLDRRLVAGWAVAAALFGALALASGPLDARAAADDEAAQRGHERTLAAFDVPRRRPDLLAEYAATRRRRAPASGE